MNFESFKLGTAEKKLLTVFCYFMLVQLVSVTGLTVYTKNTPQLLENIEKYFICEQGGHNPSNPCSRSNVDKWSNPFLDAVGYFVLAFFPFVNLIYVVNIGELKELWRKWCAKYPLT